ncbi:MAG: hypothetical protein IJF07_09380 [Lachnospiraceae bacterium]|nr:hypothetical protein [Lachnospiraceae bacterium]
MENLVAGGLFQMLMGLPFLAVFGVLGVALAIGIAFYVLGALPVYQLAKNAGLPNAWLAWIPYGNVYILLLLAKREFNIFDWIRTYDRTKVFWYYLIIALGGMVAISLVTTILGFIPIINILVGIISPIVKVAYIVALRIFNWRVYYDIYMTYGLEENAMLLAVLSSIFPVVMIVCMFIIKDRQPNYNV